MQEELEKHETLFSHAILFCQEILPNRSSKGDEVASFSLINTFDELIISISSTTGEIPANVRIPIDFLLFVKLADTKPRSTYEIFVKVLSPSKELLFNIMGTMRNTNLEGPSFVGDIHQTIQFEVKEPGKYLVVIEFENKLVAQREVTVLFEYDPKVIPGG